jgi:hypothetical protein
LARLARTSPRPTPVRPSPDLDHSRSRLLARHYNREQREQSFADEPSRHEAVKFVGTSCKRSAMLVRRPLSSHPALARELDDDCYTPDDLGVSTSTVMWWRCQVDPRHRWMADVKSRPAGTGRAQCSWCRRVASLPDGQNPSLRTSHPGLARQWDALVPVVAMPRRT